MYAVLGNAGLDAAAEASSDGGGSASTSSARCIRDLLTLRKILGLEEEDAVGCVGWAA